MKCKKCNSDRIIKVQAHSKDCNHINYKNKEYGGYAPGPEIGLDQESGSDDVIITYCLECGQIQNDFPIKLIDCLEDPKLKYYDCENCPLESECQHV